MYAAAAWCAVWLLGGLVGGTCACQPAGREERTVALAYSA